MKKHLRVLRTLFVKDIVDMFKNPNVLLMLALPLIFIVIYQFVDLGMSPAYLLMLGVMMNLCLTPLSVLGMMIAEEKEKNTMRTLMLLSLIHIFLERLVGGQGLWDDQRHKAALLSEPARGAGRCRSGGTASIVRHGGGIRQAPCVHNNKV